MNNQKAKSLRKQARQMTQGQPNVAYKEGEKQPTYLQQKDINGMVFRHVKVERGVPRQMEPTCTRAVYQEMK